MKSDWRKPFLELKAGLRPLYDANLNLHHCVLLSTKRTRDELDPVFDMLEPAYNGKLLIHEIPAKTDGCTYHGHLFFSDDRRGITELGRLLYDLEEWMYDIPKGFVPTFDIPSDSYQTNRNIIRWVGMVYYLAWATDAPYLDLEIEYLESIDRVGFFPWNEWPQPPRCKPLEWLTHRSSAVRSVAKAIRSFEDRGERFPDMIDAYLTGEFIASSLAAIDILIYVLDRERKERSGGNEAYVESLSEKREYKKTKRERKELERMLLQFHSRWENTETKTNPEEPLTQLQIAEEMEWITGSKKPDTSRVHNRMKAIFGNDPMKVYRRELFKAVRGTQPSELSLMYFAIAKNRANEDVNRTSENENAE